jgi:hypothetical protein
MRRGVWLAMIAALPGVCAAQAPAEERRLQNDAVTTAQQRITALLHDVDAADARVNAAELSRKSAEQELRDATMRLAEARKRNDAAATALRQAQDRQIRARKAYEAQASALERLRATPNAATASAKGAGH